MQSHNIRLYLDLGKHPEDLITLLGVPEFGMTDPSKEQFKKDEEEGIIMWGYLTVRGLEIPVYSPIIKDAPNRKIGEKVSFVLDGDPEQNIHGGKITEIHGDGSYSVDTMPAPISEDEIVDLS